MRTASDGEAAAPGRALAAPWLEAVHVNGRETNGAEHAIAERPSRTAAGVFRDTARTILPVEYQGREISFEAHAYEDESASYQALALVHRAPGIAKELPLVRVHSGCVTGDIFHSLRCDCYPQLQKAIDRIVDSQLGVIIYLPHHEGRGIGLVAKIKAYAAQDRGLDTVDANLSIGAPVDARDYQLAAKILKDLSFSGIRLLTNNPLKVEALQRHGIDVVEQVQHATSPSPHNARYLATKRERMAHKL
ncbi:MAG: GTP cyclohydrolase II [Hyphomicrobiaceae bacterium]|nr:GTP cyclohydrolase II [Hyphomicrobiaceae bacterium]